MNLLSLGAALGALVWVFQEGHLGGLVGTEALGSLTITTPVLVVRDRVRAVDGLRGVPARRASRSGGGVPATTTWRSPRACSAPAGIVTAAALLHGASCSPGFVAGGFSPIKQVGLGLVLAVALDATVVRMLLVPATMTLLGRANWWAPGPLRRLHDRVRHRRGRAGASDGCGPGE